MYVVFGVNQLQLKLVGATCILLVHKHELSDAAMASEPLATKLNVLIYHNKNFIHSFLVTKRQLLISLGKLELKLYTYIFIMFRLKSNENGTFKL